MAAATFNANAALISITTDKDTYNVGETITATVSASKLSVGGVQTYFNGYIALFNFDSLFLSLDVSSIMDLGALGVRPEVKTSDSEWQVKEKNYVIIIKILIAIRYSISVRPLK